MKIRFKLLFFFLLRCLDLALQACIPVRDKRLSYSSRTDYTDNAYHLYLHALRTRNGLEHIWLITDMEELRRKIETDFLKVVEASGTTGNRLRIVHRHTLRGYWLFLTSRHVFHTQGIYRFTQHSLKRNIVSLWHGMPIKKVGLLNKPKSIPIFGTLHVATSHSFKYVVACAFRVPPEKVLLCPYPRMDALTDDAARTVNNSQLRAQLQVPKNKRLILWLPTFRSEPDELMEGLQPAQQQPKRSFLNDIAPQNVAAIDATAARHNAVVIIKLHPYDYLNDNGAKLDYPNIRVIAAEQWKRLGIPLYDLAAASDALLTDISSIMIDYLVTKRPIGIIGFDSATYSRGSAIPHSYLYASRCFQRLEDPDDFESFMASVERGDLRDVEAQNLSELFVEPAETLGSETILRHLGL